MKIKKMRNNVTIGDYFIDYSEEGWTDHSKGPFTKAILDPELKIFLEILDKYMGVVISSFDIFKDSKLENIRMIIGYIVLPDFHKKKLIVKDRNRIFSFKDLIEIGDILKFWDED